MNMSDEKTSAVSSTMEKLLEDKNQPLLPKAGDLIKGKVISLSKSAVYLDINGVATGVVRGREIIDESGEYSNLKLGEEVQATVLELENENGEFELSFRSAGHQKAWDELKRIMDKEEIVETPVTEANRGGLMVSVGRIEGFIPVSQLIPEHYPRVEGGDKNKILEHLQKMIGQKFKCKIIAVDEADNKLIVSEKAAWENQQKAEISNYKVGDIIEGKVTGVVEFGAFIEFGDGLEGLIHISELAWQRIDDPKEFIKVGEKIKAKIISIDGTKISLSTKQLKEDPWREVVKKYKVGQKVKGVVIKINPFGAFVELDRDIHGLVHISELSDKKINHPSEIVKEGEEYSLKILSIEPENHRLGLSLKAFKESAPDKAAKIEGGKLAQSAQDGSSGEKVKAEIKAEEKPSPEILPAKKGRPLKKKEETPAKGGSQPKADQSLAGAKISSGEENKKKT
ncbi:MAG: S1 RNA-binding domain-containing protein [Patescibacteria group bacterium]